MLQLGGDQFIRLLFLHLSDVWRESTYPDQWASSSMQPLYKGDGKDREDPASYRGIFLSNAMLKLFEGILESRLKVFTEKFDTLTPSQQGSRPGRQRHDAIYSLLAAIQQQKQSPQKSMQGATPSLGASYCGFVDFTTAYPSVHREKLQMILKESGITGKMWELLKENSRKMRIRVLHPLITARNEVEVLRGLPEGSRLSPTLFAIFAADLIRELQVKFPEITMPTAPVLTWMGTIFYVDDAVLIARSPEELQRMLNVCQEWAERNRMSINVNKTKVVVFLEDPAMRNARPRFNFTLTPAFPVPLPAKTRIKVRQELRLHRPTTSAAQERRASGRWNFACRI